MNTRKMQPMMVPDFIDGTHKINKPYADLSQKWCSYSNVIEFNDKSYTINPDKVKQANLECKTDNDKILLGYFLDRIKEDKPFKSFFMSYNHYCIHKKNYLVSKDITKQFKETKLTIKKKHIPQEFSGFLKIPDLVDEDKEKIQGVFVSIRTINKNRYLNISTAIKIHELLVGYFSIKLDDFDKEATLSDMVSQLIKSNLVSKDDPYTNFYKEEYIKVILNTVSYITCSNADLVESINSFSTKKSKRTTQKKIFTPKKYIFVGSNFHRVVTKKTESGEVTVTGHWRWQAHGPLWSLHKWVFIEEHQRN